MDGKIKDCWFVRLPPAQVYHSGDLGDIIYSLLWCRHELGNIDLILGPDPRWPLRHVMDAESFRFLEPLLTTQSWIKSVSYSPTRVSDAICLNDFRRTWFSREHRSTRLFEAYAEQFGTDPCPEDVAWLKVDPWEIPGKPVVISRSPRYRDPMFPWYNVSTRFSGQMVFIGFKDEYDEWINHFGKTVDYQPVSNALEMARVIAGASLFIGNQSFPLSLAMAMQIPVVQETYPQGPDCVFRRPDATYYNGRNFYGYGHLPSLSLQRVPDPFCQAQHELSPVPEMQDTLCPAWIKPARKDWRPARV